MKEDWQGCQLGDAINLKRGYDLPKKERSLGTFPIISSSGFSDTHSVAKVKGPGVVTGRYGTIGTVYFVQGDFWPLNTALYVQDFKGNDPHFISYFLRGLDFQAYSDKAAVPGINRNDLHQAEILLPPLLEQRAIAATLGALDNKIELNLRMNETLEAMARALFRDWFVDFGPTRRKIAGATDPAAILGHLLHDPTQSAPLAALFPDSFGAGEFPEGWSLSTIGEVAKNHSETMDLKKRQKVIFINTGDVSQGRFLHADYSDANGLPGQAKKKIEVGDILYSEIRPKNKRFAFVNFDAPDHIVSTKFMVLRTISTVSPIHLYFLVSSPEAVAEFNTTAESRSGTFPQITFDSIKHYPVMLASEGIMKAFREILELIFGFQWANEQANETLAQTRDLLLPRLMSGELRVTDLDQVEEETAA
ncbi:restriction endonuclease subunit S [Roseovarius sp. Pro17]|uniref:restriction endonuclease subunit S n=1 Tax=Roseovarius sp. Pro17 TaxID=3108175 RepID=UPI002D772AA7|nr:restriction endonuclease subunit S [Roseovarius sp. Pro17]